MPEDGEQGARQYKKNLRSTERAKAKHRTKAKMRARQLAAAKRAEQAAKARRRPEFLPTLELE